MPMAMFYGLINIACINSYVIYSHNISKKGEKVLNRKNFMKSLSVSLTSPFMKERLQVPTLKRHLRDDISNIVSRSGSSSQQEVPEESLPKKRSYCAYCPYNIRRKANASCTKCNKVICREHNIDLCQKCL